MKLSRLVFLLPLLLFSLISMPQARASVQVYGRWETMDFNVYVDGSCNVQWRSLIESGFKMWQVGFQFNYHYTSNSVKSANTAYFYCEGAFPSWQTGDSTYDWTVWEVKYEANGIRIFNTTFTMLTSAGQYVFLVGWAAQHEIGHVLGLLDDTTPNSLMNHDGKSTIQRSHSPSQAEYDALNALYTTPIPEYPTAIIPLAATLLLTMLIMRKLDKKGYGS